MIDLNKYRRRVYSQSGEDGILEKLFESLNIKEGWFCEFGAGDGNNISNTKIFREKGWSGVLIEGDTDRFNKMNKAKEIISNKNIHLIKEYISCESGEKIDDLLSNSVGIPLHDAIDLRNEHKEVYVPNYSINVQFTKEDSPLWRT